jgi:hypothetical protein
MKTKVKVVIVFIVVLLTPLIIFAHSYSPEIMLPPAYRIIPECDHKYDHRKEQEAKRKLMIKELNYYGEPTGGYIEFDAYRNYGIDEIDIYEEDFGTMTKTIRKKLGVFRFAK